jgi:hypothetical protein
MEKQFSSESLAGAKRVLAKKKAALDACRAGR